MVEDAGTQDFEVPPPPIRQFGRTRELDHVLKRLQSTPHGAGVFILSPDLPGSGSPIYVPISITHLGRTAGSSRLERLRQETALCRMRLFARPSSRSSSALLYLPKTVKRMLTPRSEVGIQDGGSEEQYRLASELAQVLAGLADGAPLAILLDDVQWMDPALQAILVRLAATGDLIAKGHLVRSRCR